MKRTAGSTVNLYPFAHYELSGSTVIKYYYFNGQRIAMKRGTTLTYLHSDHLGSTVLETNTSGTATANQQYFAYGKQRDTGPVVTEHKFTGQKLDGTGLQYYNSRYYDPAIGVFVSPDTLVPDAMSVFDYNRFMYVRGRVLNANDPSGHEPCVMGNWGDCLPSAMTNPQKQVLTDRQTRVVLAETNIKVQGGGTGPLRTSEAIIGEAVYDFAQKVGGTDQLKDLIGGGTSFEFGRLDGNVEGRTARDGDPIALDSDAWLGNNQSTLNRKGVVVHELAHVIDYRTSFGIFNGMPREGDDIPTMLANGTSGREEHFGSIVTSWVYGDGVDGGIYGYNGDWRAGSSQIDWLERNFKE